MSKIVTVVLTNTGDVRAVSANISEADAVRWAAEGCQVFRLAIGGAPDLWAVRHVNSNSLFGPQRDRVERDVTPEVVVEPPALEYRAGQSERSSHE